MTKTFRIYGADGHRMKYSFEPSVRYDWSRGDAVRILEIRCSDKTGTNDYIDVVVSTNTRSPEAELLAQIEDGIFEDMRTGRVYELIGDEHHDFIVP